MSTTNKVLIHRWFEEVWNQKRREAIKEMLHPHATIHGLTGISSNKSGPEAFTPFWERFVAAFPDLKISVESTVAEDDKVVARCSVRGKHTGLGLGIPPTNASISFSGMCMAEIRDGKLFEGWNLFDFLTFYQQIGLVPAFAAP